MSEGKILSGPYLETEKLGEFQMESSTIDFVMLLPLELVYLVVSFLSLPNFLSCLAVCRPWNKRLTQMDHYWRSACLDLGLSRATFELLVNLQSSAKKLLYIILQHRHSIWSYRPRLCQYGEGLPHYKHYVCHHVKGDYMAGTVYKNFCPHQIMVHKLAPDGVTSLAVIKPTYPMHTENRILWAHIFQGSHLMCATASGLWSVYNFTTPTKQKRPPVTVQWKAEPMYDLDIRIDSCDQCGMIGTAKFVLDHLHGAHWELRIIQMSRESFHGEHAQRRLPLPSVTKFNLKIVNEYITSMRNTHAKKRFVLLSATDSVQQRGFCASHLILVQWAHVIESHKLVFQSDRGTSHCPSSATPHQPRSRMSHQLSSGSSLQPSSSTSLLVSGMPGECYKVHIDKEDVDEAVMRNRGLNTEFTLTEDKQLLGYVFQLELVTWKIGSPAATSRAKVTLKTYNHEDVKLIALGHMYSIIGLEYQQSVLVVVTRTGEIVLNCSNFAIRHSNMLAPYIVFCSCSGRGWLSDMSLPCVCTVLYWNKTSRCMEAIELGQEMKKSLDSQVAPSSQQSPRRLLWWKRS